MADAAAAGIAAYLREVDWCYCLRSFVFRMRKTFIMCKHLLCNAPCLFFH